jgi:hypothetical protein
MTGSRATRAHILNRMALQNQQFIQVYNNQTSRA